MQLYLWTVKNNRDICTSMGVVGWMPLLKSHLNNNEVTTSDDMNMMFIYSDVWIDGHTVQSYIHTIVDLQQDWWGWCDDRIASI